MIPQGEKLHEITSYDVYTKEMLERDIFEKRGGRVVQLSDGKWAIIAT